MIDRYLTILTDQEPELYKEKGSKFIGYLYPAASKETAEEILASIRKKFHDATHVCYAYRLWEGEKKTFRYNDDGEPSGTAGLPIYNEIKRAELFDVLTAVVRYYGGTKLGTGGLARAYSASARMVIEATEKHEKIITAECIIQIPFSFQGEIMNLINTYECGILSQEYGEHGTTFRIEIPLSGKENFRLALIERSGGKIDIK